ncbi:HNH endonuclease [Herbaspirillum sp. HC18]|nr:HNH endonuclease [Herbaspirillum sp. HC18]
MKVIKVADIVRVQVRLLVKAPLSTDIGAFLTNLEVTEEPDPKSRWKFSIEIGSGPAAKTVTLDLAPQLSLSSPTDRPFFLEPSPVVYFRDSLFLPEHYDFTEEEREEILLRVKKQAFEEQAELSRLKATVNNLERALEYARTEQRREPIPESVKLLVWARDKGACVKCGSQENLHFDHVIPVAKGGGNSEENIQILCRICNLRKSDKIAEH